MTSHDDVPRVVSTSREIAAGPQQIFELIADPTQQPRWDGNDNLAEAPAGERIRRTGDVFLMTTTKGNVRENHVVEFEADALPGHRPSLGCHRRGTSGAGNWSRSTRLARGLPTGTTGPS